MTRPQIERRIASFDPSIRCYLFHGADEAGSRALAARVQATIGPDLERIDLTPAQLKADPSLLADEAASRSLFGAARCIRVDGVGDESAPAVAALIQAPAAGDPVILVAGTLRKDARLLDLLGSQSAALVHASHPPVLGDLVRIAIDEGEARGLRVGRDLAERLVVASGGDRAVLGGEVSKLADYADASPDAPRAATDAMLDAIGADRAEADTGVVLHALFSGDLPALDRALGHAALEPIPLLRAAQRRLLAMASARADVDRGATPRAAVDRLGRMLFWREKDGVVRDLPRWSGRRLAAALDRCAALERTLKSSRGPGTVAAEQLYHMLGRSVRR